MTRILFNLLMVLFGIMAGWLGARYFMETATASSSASNGGWQEIRLGGEGLRPTYQAAHFLWRGQVPPPVNVRLFRRSTDDAGHNLRGDCAVRIAGDSPKARWWFIATEGQDIDAALSAADMVREPDGSFIVTLSVPPQPGNWLAVEDDGEYSLRLVVEDSADQAQTPRLPAVQRLGC